MKNELSHTYNLKKIEIKSRISDFKNTKQEKYFEEFIFCLLTPQSNAKKCWQAVEELLTLKNWNENEIKEILKSKTRFHNNKTKYVMQAKETFRQVEPLLKTNNKLELRNKIHQLVNGYGLKEAGHFLRNIGHSDNQIAILDRHILRNLKSLGVIEDEKIKNKNHYLEIEQKFLNFSKEINIPIDELDLLFWSKENGSIFK